MRDGLAATIESVLAQTYPHLEYLIIDGGSVDGSVDLIHRFASRITYWVSEPDRGIYDAMNKGVLAATGEWVIFMNSGDRLHDRNTIADVFSQDHSDVDLVYGHSTNWYASEELEKFKPAESQTTLPLRMNCSHQSLFTRRSLLLEQPFSLDFLAADYEFLVRMYTEGRHFRSVDRIVAVNTTGGVSDVKRLRSLTERAKIAIRHGLMTPRRTISYLRMGLFAILGPHVKRVLPKQVRAWILKRKTAE
jgi:glycosyltransferase involved in cell wall biosynthesis